jgi:hypothetical protein
MLRRVFAGLGLLLAGLGIAVALVPSVADVVRLPDIPTIFVGGFAVTLAAATFAARKRVTFRDPAEASVRASGLENRFEPPRPGEDIDRELAASDAGALDVPLRERLRILTVRVLTESEGWSEAEANRRLKDGTWTEDRTAAALFADDIAPPAQDVVVSLAGIESARERELRHVLAELERRSGIDVEGGD